MGDKSQWRAWIDAGRDDDAERDRLLEPYIGRAMHLASKLEEIAPRIGAGDLHAAAWIGLNDAAQTFDPDKSRTFWSWAYWKVRHHVLDDMRSLGGHSRKQLESIKQMATVRIVLMQELGRMPTDDEVRDALGWSRTKWRNAHLETWADLSPLPDSDIF